MLSLNVAAHAEIITLSLHDALPICRGSRWRSPRAAGSWRRSSRPRGSASRARPRSGSTSSSTRSEEHTSELQSRFDLVCRLLLEKKNRPDQYVIAVLQQTYSRSAAV